MGAPACRGGVEAGAVVGPVEDAVRRELGDRAGSALGLMAATLARQLDDAGDPTPAATVARELRLLLVEIDRVAPAQTRSVVDDLRARRASREKASG